jgi:hypothetical protein
MPIESQQSRAYFPNNDGAPVVCEFKRTTIDKDEEYNTRLKSERHFYLSTEKLLRTCTTYHESYSSLIDILKTSKQNDFNMPMTDEADGERRKNENFNASHRMHQSCVLFVHIVSIL